MKRNQIAFVLSVFLFTLIYSIVRYNIFSDVPWSDLPLFVMNKAISFSAIIFISIYIILEKKDHHELSIKIRKYATNLVFIHLTISLVIFTQIYYPKYFDGLKLSFLGQLSLLAGIISLGLINSIRHVKKVKPEYSTSLFSKYGTGILLILISLHLLLIGFPGWITPEKWQGCMPPITLLSFIVAVIPFFIKKKALPK